MTRGLAAATAAVTLLALAACQPEPPAAPPAPTAWTIGPDGIAPAGGAAVALPSGDLGGVFPGLEVAPLAGDQGRRGLAVTRAGQDPPLFVLEQDDGERRFVRVRTTHPDVAGPNGARVGQSRYGASLAADVRACRLEGPGFGCSARPDGRFWQVFAVPPSPALRRARTPLDLPEAQRDQATLVEMYWLVAAP